MKKFFIIVFGCDRRKLDAQRISNYLLKNNHQVVNNPHEADYILFLACGFSNISIKVAYDTIKKFQKKYKAELIVAGCLPAIDPQGLSEIFNGRTIITKDLNLHPEKVDQLIAGSRIEFRDIPDTNVHSHNFSYGYKSIETDNTKKPLDKTRNVLESLSAGNFSIVKSVLAISNLFPRIKNHVTKNLIGNDSFIFNYLSDKKIYHLRITWGCTGNCSYCGIKKAVGPIQSKPLDVCLNEFKKGLQSGYKEYLINSDDSGAYGVDIGLTFPYLLDKLTDIKGDYVITLSGLNPIWVVKYIDDLEKIVKKRKIKEIIVTIQAGSSRILQLMNRYHNVDEIRESYKRLKKSYPDLKLFLQMIIGFPTETDEEFQKSVSFIKEFDFNIINLFPFYPVPGTEANEIEPKVPQETIFKRLKTIEKFLKKKGYASIYVKSSGYLFYKK